MTNIKHKLLTICIALLLFVSVLSVTQVSADGGGNTALTGTPVVNTSQTTKSPNQCGSGADAVVTAINIGCKRAGNPITDMTFAIIRFLSAGVGLVIIGSIIVAGIQYSASGGDPQAAAKAKSRISSTLTALVIFIFSYALLNYLIPGGFFNG